MFKKKKVDILDFLRGAQWIVDPWCLMVKIDYNIMQAPKIIAYGRHDDIDQRIMIDSSGSRIMAWLMLGKLGLTDRFTIKTRNVNPKRRHAEYKRRPLRTPVI